MARGSETIGPLSAGFLTGVADVITTGIDDKEHAGPLALLALVGVSGFGAIMRTGEWSPIMVLDAGLRTSDGPATIERGVNSGASGFSFDPCKAEVIRNC